MTTKRQIAMHAGGGGHDGAVAKGDVNVHGKTVLVPHPALGMVPVHVPLSKGEKQGLHDQAVKDGRTQDAADIHKHLEKNHGGGGSHE
jgi:hypothetical protein